MRSTEKPLLWIGSSLKDLLDMPPEVRRFFGFVLSLAQVGDRHESTKVLHGFGGAGVLEIIEGKSTPRLDMDLIHARLKMAQALAKVGMDENTRH